MEDEMEHLKNLRLLIIDDDPGILRNLRVFFEDENFIVSTAQSGEQGLQKVEGQSFDAAIVDMRLPGMNGKEFIIQASKLQPGIKFIIYTGSMDFNLGASLNGIGVSDKDVFLKPIKDMSLLLNRISILYPGN